MHRNLASVSYIWNHEVYWGWYEYIGDDASDKAIGIEVEVEVEIEFEVRNGLKAWLHLIEN